MSDWEIEPETPEEADEIALFKRAGVLPHEVHRIPGQGIGLSTSGVRKLAAIAPDQDLAKRFMDFIAEAEAKRRGPN